MSRRSNVPEVKCPGCQMSGGQMSGGQMSGGQMSGGQMSRGQMSCSGLRINTEILRIFEILKFPSLR